MDTSGKKVKVADGINRLKTVKERSAKAKLIISELEKDTDIKVKSNKILIAAALADAVQKRWIDLRPKTRQTYQSKLTVFLDYCKSNKLIYTYQIDTARVDAFFVHLRTVRKNGNTTLNHYREVFFTLFSVFSPKDENPFERVKLKKASPTPALYFQNHQRALLKAYMSKHDAQLWRFVEFIFYCFIRPGELRQLKVI